MPRNIVKFSEKSLEGLVVLRGYSFEETRSKKRYSRSKVKSYVREFFPRRTVIVVVVVVVVVVRIVGRRFVVCRSVRSCPLYLYSRGDGSDRDGGGGGEERYKWRSMCKLRIRSTIGFSIVRRRN